ncbi:MAG: M48 family metallopeptidase [Alphaproteobacteria bacterium]|nr:M48 family metallopeptidase [Alphaproteobacteria bacterium]
MGQNTQPSTASGKPVYTTDQLRALVHPKQKRNLIIALLACVPVILLFCAISIFTNGIFMLVVALAVISLWFIRSFVKAQLIGSSARVSPDNFPAIHALASDICSRVGFNEPIDIFLVEDGTVNAYLWQLFRTNFLVINSKTVEEMSGSNLGQIAWIIARFVGAVKAKQTDLVLLRTAVEATEKAKIFNLFIYPYLRSTQYSGDQIGLAIGQDLGASIGALNKLLVGGKLGPDVSISAISAQAHSLRATFFGWLTTMLSPFPHLVSRHINLLEFARFHYPDFYGNYMEKQTSAERHRIEGCMPGHYGTFSG